MLTLKVIKNEDLNEWVILQKQRHCVKAYRFEPTNPTLIALRFLGRQLRTLNLFITVSAMQKVLLSKHSPFSLIFYTCIMNHNYV